MIITCKECSTRFNLDESILKTEGSKVRCSLCQHVFTAFPPVPPPPPAPGPGKESDFSTQSQDDEFNDKESVFEETEFEIDDLDFDIEEAGLDFGETSLEMEGSGEDSTDIEISFDPELEISEFDADDLSFDDVDSEFDDPDLNMEAPADLADFDSMEFETLDQDSLNLTSEDTPEADLSFEEDPDADLVFEENDLEQELEPGYEMEDSDDRDMTFPDLKMEADTDQTPTDEIDPDLRLDTDLITSLEPEPDKIDTKEMSDQPDNDFSSYDQVLEQETEPEDNFQDQDQDQDQDDEEIEIEKPGRNERWEATEPDTLMENAMYKTQDSIDPALSLGQPKKRRRKSSMGAPVMLLLLLFILVAAAYIASISLGYKIPYLSDVKIPFIEHYLKKETPAKPAPKPIPNEGSVNGRFISNNTAGELFVITGRIENPAAIPYSHIQVKGTLITKGKVKAQTQIIFCGNIISEEMLKTGNISDINKELTRREGANDSNVNVKPGGFVPFMLVFSSLPENLENFTVEVVGF